MRGFLSIFSVCCVALMARPLSAQQPDQQVLNIFTNVSRHANQLQPMLEQVHVNDWVAKGAPTTYVNHFASLNEQLHAIVADMEALAPHPEHMQECMKALFRIQAFHRSLDSIMGGLRRYQNPALADLIQSVAAGDQSDLDKLETWTLELADRKEQEFQVVDHEAQRCRATLSKQPAPPAKTTRRATP